MNCGGLHRVKRLWRFTDNDRVDAPEVQMALVPHTIAQLGFPRLLALAIDWTMFDTTLPSGERMRYQVLHIAGAWLVRADEAVTTSCQSGPPARGRVRRGQRSTGRSKATAPYGSLWVRWTARRP
jgi:hypothetical protein